MKKIRITIAIVAALSALVLPTAALANSGQQGYGGPNGAVAGVNSSGGNDSDNSSTSPESEEAGAVEEEEVASSGSTLPFTGLDVGYIAAAGIVLLGTGFLLRRVTHRGQSL